MDKLEQLERAAIVVALKRAGWVQKTAAEDLGISARRLNYLVAKHGITHDRWHRNRPHELRPATLEELEAAADAEARE